MLVSLPPELRESLLISSWQPLVLVPRSSGDSVDLKNLLKKMRVACDRRRSKS